MDESWEPMPYIDFGKRIVDLDGNDVSELTVVLQGGERRTLPAGLMDWFENPDRPVGGNS